MKRFLWLGLICFFAVASVAFMVANKTRVVMIGDSTVRSGQEEYTNPVLWGWGTVLKELYDSDNVEFINEAVAGTSSRTFYRDEFQDVLNILESGDILLLQFGHNDVSSVTGDGSASIKGIGDGTQTVTNSQGQVEVVRSYGWYLRQMVQQAKAKGVRPIVVSPVPRYAFVEGFTVRSLEEYGLWARQIATEEAVDFLDLNNLVADLYDFMGEEAVRAYFPSDNLHTNKEGAKATAEIVYKALNDQKILANPLLNTWEVMGGGTDISATTAVNPDVIPVKEGENIVPYAVYTTTAGMLVKKRGADGVWIQVGDILSTFTNTNSANNQNIAQSRIWTDALGKLYVTYVVGNVSNRLAVKYYNKDTDTWQPLGDDANNLYLSTGGISMTTNGIRNIRNHELIFDRENVPYVAYGEFAGTGYPYVKRFKNGVWETLGGTQAASVRILSPNLAFDSNNVLYFSYVKIATGGTSGVIEVLRFKEGVWSVFQTFATGAGSSTRFLSSAIANDVLYLHFMNTTDGSRATWTYTDLKVQTPVWMVPARVSSLNPTITEFHDVVADPFGNIIFSYVNNYTNVYVHYLPKGTALPATLVTLPNTGLMDTGGSYSSLKVASDGKPYIVYVKNNVPLVQRYHVDLDVVPEPEPEEPQEPDEVVNTPRWMETLDRGLVAVRPATNRVFLSWRLLGDEPLDLGFNVYRDNIKLNDTPITGVTNYQDVTEENGKYTVVPVINGEEKDPSKTVEVWAKGFLSIPLDMPPTGLSKNGEFYTHTANDLSVADLDGDGEYELIVKWEPTLSGDNLPGQRGKVYFDAYKMDGTKLWRIDMGINIRAGAHYNPFMVYDLDGDGMAELVVRTSDGTVDGQGNVIGDANADWRENSGFILSGPEFLSVFNGKTGREMARTNFIPERGRVADWGDGYGNRVDRFVAAVAYLDGERPSIVWGRGYYTRMVRAAWDWRDGQLTSRWVFDTNDPGNKSYEHAGNHQMSVADMDNDGKDEIINGASVINDNGKKYYNTGRGHGDALHVSRMDPNRDMQMVWQPHESPSTYKDLAITLVNGKTGETLFGIPATRDIGRAMAADIDPRYVGYEMWSAAGGLYNVNGTQVSPAHPGSMNFGSWWDGDLLRELLDGTSIYKWDYNTNVQKLVAAFGEQGALSNNSTKANPGLSADILGDWREEAIYRSTDSKHLLVFTTAIPTTHKLYTLMHDSQYRTAVAWQNSGYNQPPHPSFYLGEGMAQQEQPNIALVELEKKPQEITFAELSAVTYDKGSILPGATATSGLRIKYTVDNPSIVQVENQSLKFVGVGTVTITAQQEGNFGWEAAEPVTRTLVINKGIQTITFAELPVITVRDEPYEPTVTASSGLPVSIASEDAFFASIADGRIVANEGGRVGIVATQSGNNLWEPATAVRRELEVRALPDMEVSKAVTPNGDGDHDALMIQDIERYPENKVTIYSRQGLLLFSISNYNNRDRVFEGRDSAGRILNDGTYFYKLEWTNEGKSLNQSGWFYLKK